MGTPADTDFYVGTSVCKSNKRTDTKQRLLFLLTTTYSTIGAMRALASPPPAPHKITLRPGCYCTLLVPVLVPVLVPNTLQRH